MILYINACVRSESRTAQLARHLISRLEGQTLEFRPAEAGFPTVDESFIARRDSLIGSGRFDDQLFAPARAFAAADEIVIAAPYWDLSFPAALKQYFEQINVVGITFRYSPEGIPVSLCRAKRLFYITTAGGVILSDDYGFGYVRSLAENFYHIPEVYQVKAEGLDLPDTDIEGVLRRSKEDIDCLIGKLS